MRKEGKGDAGSRKRWADMQRAVGTRERPRRGRGGGPQGRSWIVAVRAPGARGWAPWVLKGLPVPGLATPVVVCPQFPSDPGPLAVP